MASSPLEVLLGQSEVTPVAPPEVRGDLDIGLGGLRGGGRVRRQLE